MAQYIYTMNRVSKVVPPKRTILRDISLSFFPGAKIGVLGLNGSGKSSLLRIMAGTDSHFDGEARPQSGIRVGHLPQEPELDPAKDVRSTVMEGLGESFRLVMIGVAVGTAITLLCTRSLQSMLFGLQPDDPLTLLSTGLLLLAVALLASFMPARAAAKVNPIQALRHE